MNIVVDALFQLDTNLPLMHLFLKNADKMFCRFIADLIGNICNGEICILKQYLSSLQTYLLHNLCKGPSGGRFK